MSKFIHHDRATSDWMDEEDGFDLIETDDGFHVYRRDRMEETYDTLDEATDAMHRLLEEEDAKHSEEERKRVVEAREKKLFQTEAEEIADIACLIINRRARNFQTRYAAQGLLEHVIPILQARV
jgi:hypothetical protein